MKLVIVESPYAGDVATNTAYARACLADCLRRGEAPLASHLLYTQPGVLRDDVPGERALGIEAGLAWGRVAELTAVYTDLGVSSGMTTGIARAQAEGRPVEMRTVPGWRRPAVVAPVAVLAGTRTALPRAMTPDEGRWVTRLRRVLGDCPKTLHLLTIGDCSLDVIDASKAHLELHDGHGGWTGAVLASVRSPVPIHGVSG